MLSFVIRFLAMLLLSSELVRIRLPIAIHKVLFSNSVVLELELEFEIVDELEAVLEVYFVFHRDLVHLFEDGPDIFDLAELDQERYVLV